MHYILHVFSENVWRPVNGQRGWNAETTLIHMYSHTVIRLRFVQFKCDIQVIERINMFGIFQKVFYSALWSMFF